MESSEIGQKMREAFEATAPSDEAVLRRYAHLRALRSGEDLPTAIRFPHRASRLAPSLVRMASAGGVALLAAAGAFFLWGLPADEPVPIAPSLERDLALGIERDRPSESPRSVPASPVPARSLNSAPVEAGSWAASATAPRSEAGPPGESSAAVTAADAPGDPAPSREPETDATVSWAKVTEAMKARDWPAAQVALAPLLASNDEETRDSARLVRIRLELGAVGVSGPDQQLVTELDELARTGSTSSIRASARRLHKSLMDAQTKHPATDGELPGVEE